jgi:WD40 repeat protein
MLILKDKKVGLCCLAFSPDGQTLAVGGYRGTIQLWDLNTQTLAARPPGCRWSVNAVFFSGEQLCAVEGIELWAWASTTARPRHPRKDRRTVAAIAAAPDGRQVAISFCGGSIEGQSLPDFETQWRMVPRTGGATTLSYSGDGRWLARGDALGNVVVTDVATRKVRHAPAAPGVAEVKAVALSPDGGLFAWCAASHLHLWRLDRLEEVKQHALGRTHFLSVAFHPLGEFFATVNGDGKVDYWDARSGEHRQAFDWQVGKLNDIVFDPAGDRAACCGDTGEVVVWDVDR